MTKTLDYEYIFSKLPERTLLLTPDFVMVAATDAYYKITHTSPEQILNKNVFDVFPENEETKKHDGGKTLSHSLEHVCKTKKTHVMPTLRFDIKTKDSNGKFTRHWWRVTNSPILDDKGEIVYIANDVEDISNVVDVLEDAQDVLRDQEKDHK